MEIIQLTLFKVVAIKLNAKNNLFFFVYLALIRKGYPSKESNYRNPEFRIGAALAYTTQLLNVLAHFLNIKLPRRLSYR